MRAVGKSLRDEIRAPKRLLTGLGFILLGTSLAVGFDLLGQAVIGWVAGAVAVVSGLLNPAARVWRHVETFTKEARTKLQNEKKKSERSVHRLKVQLDLIDPARRLEKLLGVISSTDRYERYRGLTGRIRYDLDQLSRDLTAAQERWVAEGKKSHHHFSVSSSTSMIWTAARLAEWSRCCKRSIYSLACRCS
jgi:hypothetical protein